MPLFAIARYFRPCLQAMQDHGSRDLPATADCGWKREPAGELRLAVGPHHKVAGAATTGISIFSVGAKTHGKIRIPSENNPQK